MRKINLIILISLLILSCKKEVKTTQVKVVVSGPTLNYSISIRSEDGKKTYIDEKTNSGVKTYTATTSENERLIITLSSGSNFNWNYKAYRNDGLVDDYTVLTGSFSKSF